MERNYSYHYDFPAQPFHPLIAALHQHHNVISITSIQLFLSSLSSGAKKPKGLIHLPTNSHLHLFAFYSFFLIIKGSLKPTIFFLPFTTELASLFFTKAFSKDDRPFTSSTAVTGDLRANNP
jgi:cellulose synthase/poly-beta-1,6-N-acetylglucosamine synthase-like glycosyltransferase